MSNKILVLQQVAHEGLGRLYASIRRAGAAEEVLPCYLDGATIPDDLSGYDALVVLGGPMSAEDADTDPILARQLVLISQAIEQDFPTLGICLGAQLIAAATGARVFRGDDPEIGWGEVHLSMESAEDPLFHDLPNPLPVFQWHGDGFDLPTGALHLASSPGFPHQAFRLGRNVYGLQFHVEMEEPMIKEWITENADELMRVFGSSDGEDIIRDAGPRCEAMGEVSFQIAERWLKLVAAHR